MSLNESNSIILNKNVAMNWFSYSCRDEISTSFGYKFIYYWTVYLHSLSMLFRTFTTIIYELKLILFYTLTCWTFELIKGNSIRWISMVHWLFQLWPSVISFQVGREYLFDNDSRLTYIVIVYPSRVIPILFMTMRYIEMGPLSTINGYEILFFHSFCNTSHLHWICVDYRLQLLFISPVYINTFCYIET